MQDAAAFISNLPLSVNVEITHHFAPGVYIRQMRLPAGAQLLSKVHKTEHFFKLDMGRILVYDGIHEAVILEAPFTGKTMPGAQRIGVALSPVLWCNIHPTKIMPVADTADAVAEAVRKIERKVIQPFKNLKHIRQWPG